MHVHIALTRWHKEHLDSIERLKCKNITVTIIASTKINESRQVSQGLSIEWARVRVSFATVLKFGHFRPLRDAPVHSCE